MNKPRMTQLVTVERVEKLIHLARGEKVLLDADLAVLYGVATGALNRAVKRNASRFPPDFMFQLTADEVTYLKCQIGISSLGHGGRCRSLPFDFLCDCIYEVPNWYLKDWTWWGWGNSCPVGAKVARPFRALHRNGNFFPGLRFAAPWALVARRFAAGEGLGEDGKEMITEL